MAVQQQERWTAAGVANSERGLANVDVLECEALEQRHLLGLERQVFEVGRFVLGCGRDCGWDGRAAVAAAADDSFSPEPNSPPSRLGSISTRSSAVTSRLGCGWLLRSM
jgi:hypothetical protein